MQRERRMKRGKKKREETGRGSLVGMVTIRKMAPTHKIPNNSNELLTGTRSSL